MEIEPSSPQNELKNYILRYGIFTLYIVLIVVVEVFYRQPLFDKSLEWIEDIQKNISTKSLDMFWEVITAIGTQAVLLPMFFIVYLFKSLKYSYIFLSVLALSVFIDNLMKNIYANPRPYMINRNIEIKHCDAGFGNPSGHSFSSTACYLAFFHIMTDIDWFKNELKRILFRVFILLCTIVIVVMIMYSRFYLGVHSLNQLIYGCSCGLGLYGFYFFLIEMHQMSDKEFINLFYERMKIYLHIGLFLFFVIINFGLYLINTHDTTEYNKIVEQYCPKIYLYRRFDNDAGINSLTIFAMIGAYFGLVLIVNWLKTLRKDDNEEKLFSNLNNWNNSDWVRFFKRLGLSLVLTAVAMSMFLFVSGHSHLAVVIIFKIVCSFLFAGLTLYGLVLFLAIKYQMANETFDMNPDSIRVSGLDTRELV